ncbi:MAG: putative DNA-binding domain-containing protein [Rhizobiales bacterium]|nr:putative DNA-binding domain-containing protein [Hyphomicrobiales bacterium]
MADPGQATFANALLQADLPTPVGVINPDGTPATKRFDVYRNNVIFSLIDALKSWFPVVEKLVGEEFFRAMAGEFVRFSPPNSPVLHLYGKNFAGFIAAFEPAQTVPYLPDIARLEQARRDAFHAADATAIDLEQLQSVPPEHFDTLILTTHPAMVLIQSKFAIFAIWDTNTNDVPLAVAIDAPQDVLINRPQLDVEIRTLPAGAAAFLAACENGETLGAAAQAGILSSPDFDLTAALSGSLAAQVFTHFKQSLVASD